MSTAHIASSPQPPVSPSKMSFLKRSLAKLALSHHKSSTFTIGSPLTVDSLTALRDGSFFDRALTSGPTSPEVYHPDEYISSPVTPPQVVEVPGLDMSPEKPPTNNELSTPAVSPPLPTQASRKSLYSEIFRSELPFSVQDSDDEREHGTMSSPHEDTIITPLDEADRYSLTTCVSERGSASPQHSQWPVNAQGTAMETPTDVATANGTAKAAGSMSPSRSAMAATAGYVNNITVHSPRAKYNPIERAKRDIAALEGGEAEFTVAMDFVLSKLVIAMSDPESAYLFRDFAGHVTSFLDRFGPGGYDSHRAPRQTSWILKLMLPWTYIEDSASEQRVANYSEVHGWIQNITHFLGSRSATVLLEEGVWDSSIEHMGSTNPIIAESAYRTAKVIVSTLPFDYELVCKVLLVRNITLGYDEEGMSTLRHNHVRLLNRVVDRIDNTKSRKNAHEFSMNLSEIIRELERSLAIETDVRVYRSTKYCLEHASDVYGSLDTLIMGSPSVLAHEVVCSTNLRSHRLRSASNLLGTSSFLSNAFTSGPPEPEHPEPARKSRWLKFSKTTPESSAYSCTPGNTGGRKSEYISSDARSLYTNASTRSRVSQHIRRFFRRTPK